MPKGHLQGVPHRDRKLCEDGAPPRCLLRTCDPSTRDHLDGTNGARCKWSKSRHIQTTTRYYPSLPKFYVCLIGVSQCPAMLPRVGHAGSRCVAVRPVSCPIFSCFPPGESQLQHLSNTQTPPVRRCDVGPPTDDAHPAPPLFARPRPEAGRGEDTQSVVGHDAGALGCFMYRAHHDTCMYIYIYIHYIIYMALYMCIYIYVCV